MPSSEPLSPARWGPFGPIPAGTRLTFVWAAPLVAAGALLLAQIPAIMAAIPFVVAAGGVEMPPMLELWMLVILAVVSFGALALLIVFWGRAFEKRGTASMGLKGRLAPGLWRYLRGLGLGLAVSIAVMTLVGLAAPQIVEPGAPVADRLLSADGLIFLAAMLAIFCFQGGVEEVVFRGWLLSSVAARRGPVVGALVSAGAFALVHAHYLMQAPLTGVLALAGVGLIGLIFAFAAMTERSVWGVCGAHGGYNFLVTAAAVVQGLAENPELRPVEVAVQAFTDVTSVTEFDPALAVMVVAIGVLAVAAWALWRRSPAAASARAAAA